jgi:hypothetical protein
MLKTETRGKIFTKKKKHGVPLYRRHIDMKIINM